jgi:hypothetical protein
MQVYRPRTLPLLTPGNGEVSCPRKGAPFAAVISVSSCKSMHDRSPQLCAERKCTQHVDSNKYVDFIARTSFKEEQARLKLVPKRPGSKNMVAKHEANNDEASAEAEPV